MIYRHQDYDESLTKKLPGKSPKLDPYTKNHIEGTAMLCAMLATLVAAGIIHLFNL